MPLLALLYLALLLILLGLLMRLKRPTNSRAWRADMTDPARAVIEGDTLTLHHVRNIHYGDPGTSYAAVWETRTYDLRELTRLWFAVESFSRIEAIAHTLVSFEFKNGEYLAFSAEARIPEGDKYGIVRGMLRNFELMYLFGTERDLILRRTNYQDHNVYLYPLTLAPREVETILRDALAGANALLETPRFYNSVTRNCTNILYRLFNRALPGTVSPLEPSQVLPGLADRFLYRKGLIDTPLPFAEIRDAYNVRELGHRYRNDPDVSVRLRETMPERREAAR